MCVYVRASEGLELDQLDVTNRGSFSEVGECGPSAAMVGPI